MGGATIIVEGKTEKELKKLLEEHKRLGKQMGLVDERLRIINYDEQAKVWRGSIWLHREGESMKLTNKDYIFCEDCQMFVDF